MGGRDIYMSLFAQTHSISNRLENKVVIGKAENEEVWKLRDTDLPTSSTLAPEGEI